MSFEFVISKFKKYISVFVIILVMIYLAIQSPQFLTADNILTVGLQMSPRAIMAIGQVCVIIAAGIDLSVGSIMALSGVITGLMLVANVNIYYASIAGIFLGAGCGMVNGFLIAYGKLPPFIATLGMMGIARGIALIITGGVAIFGFPDSFIAISSNRLGGIFPVPVLITIILGIIWSILMAKTRFGRYTYAVGGNYEATRLSGVNVKKNLMWVYTFSGLLCGIAGIIEMSRLSTGQPTAGTGYELDVIAACVIGGTSLSGGSGTVLGALMGALLIGFLRNGCNLLNISNFWQQVAIGAIIVIAVFIDQLKKENKK